MQSQSATSLGEISTATAVQKRRGFTLIEVLITIAILGILASIILVMLGGSVKKKAHDAREIHQLAQIKTAMEVYYQQHQTYPVSTEHEWGGRDPYFIYRGLNGYIDCSCSDADIFVKKLIDEGYLSQESMTSMFGGGGASVVSWRSCYYFTYDSANNGNVKYWKLVSRLYGVSARYMQNDGGVNVDLFEIGNAMDIPVLDELPFNSTVCYSDPYGE